MIDHHEGTGSALPGVVHPRNVPVHPDAAVQAVGLEHAVNSDGDDESRVDDDLELFVNVFFGDRLLVEVGQDVHARDAPPAGRVGPAPWQRHVVGEHVVFKHVAFVSIVLTFQQRQQLCPAGGRKVKHFSKRSDDFHVSFFYLEIKTSLVFILFGVGCKVTQSKIICNTLGNLV